MRKRIIAILAVCLCLLVLGACADARCTMENYEKIRVAKLNMQTFEYEGGMSLDEVKEILGDYSSSSSSTVMGQTATAYVWGSEDKNITVSFYNDMAILKAQVGL